MKSIVDKSGRIRRIVKQQPQLEGEGQTQIRQLCGNTLRSALAECLGFVAVPGLQCGQQLNLAAKMFTLKKALPSRTFLCGLGTTMALPARDVVAGLTNLLHSL
ncbi:MAG: hypothetical protein ACI9R3_000288 [Verrucomicrobiales bacterium]